MKSRHMVVLMLMALPGALTAQQFPTRPPAAAAVKPAEFPPYQEATLANGLRLVVVERHTEPVVSISLSMPAGSMYDPAGKEGLADMVAGLLTKGAGNRTAEQFAATIEGVGGSIGAAADADFMTVRADVLKPHAPLAFELLADAVMRPTFAESEVELIRTQTLSALQLSLSQPSSLASRFFTSTLYGNHPYGALDTPASVRAIKRDDLLAFQKARLNPAGALLVIAGDMKLGEAKQLAEKSFAAWTGKSAAAAEVKPPAPRTAREILLVNRPGSVQASIVVGNLTGGPADPQRYAATVANEMLGGGSEGRLFQILREKKGWTYGAGSAFNRPRGVGYFRAQADVRNEVADSALVELLAQLKRIGAEAAAADEIGGAKGALVGRFPLQIETANQVAAQVANAILLGLPGDHLRSYRTRLSAITPAEAQAAARALIRPEQSLVVVVGDAAKLHDKLKAIGSVRVVDPEGKPVDIAAGGKPAAPAALDLDMTKLAARRDSFTVMVQGNAMGFQRTVLEKTADGWRYTDETQIGPIFQQATEVFFSAKPEMRQIKQTGKVQGQDTKIDVTYGGGRAKGTSLTVSQAGPATINVDAEVPATAIDDNAVPALIPAMKWAPNAKISLPVFASGQGTLRQETYSVTGREKVTVPAGTFDVYRVEVSGGPQPITFFITTASPHRVVKVAPMGAPIELVLVSTGP